MTEPGERLGVNDSTSDGTQLVYLRLVEGNDADALESKAQREARLWGPGGEEAWKERHRKALLAGSVSARKVTGIVPSQEHG